MIKLLALILTAGLVLPPLFGCAPKTEAPSGNTDGGQNQDQTQEGESSGTENAPEEKASSVRVGPSRKKRNFGGGAEAKPENQIKDEFREEPGMKPIEEDGFIFETLGAWPGDFSCGGYTVTAEDGTVYAANISGSGTITRISPDGSQTVICDVEPWDQMKKISHLSLWNGLLYFEIGPVMNYTLYYATYHYPVNGIYRLDIAWAEEYLKHYKAKEAGYEDLPEPVSVIQNAGAMGASYAEIAYYDPLIRDGKLYYWVNNDYKKGRQLYRADFQGNDAVQLYDSADHKVISWTFDDDLIYVSDDRSIFSIDPDGGQKKIASVSGKFLQRYGEGLYFADGNKVCRILPDKPHTIETLMERDGTINGLNVYGGKIYFIEELGTGSISSYIGIASDFGPGGFTENDISYVFRYAADPDNSRYGNTYLRGPCVANGQIYYIQSFKDDKGKELGDVSYVAFDPSTGSIRETKTQ